MDAQRLPFFLAFNCLTRLRSSEAAAILEYFDGDAQAAWRQPRLWSQVAVLSPQVEADLLAQHEQIDPAALFSCYLEMGCNICVRGEDDYPRILEDIFDPPLLLFYRGTLPAADDIPLAMIGSRQASSYGRQTAEIFARDLAAQGAVIVSGLARGIDGICHRAAIDVGGRTLAVLGSGLDVIYPPEHQQLYADVCSHGAVVSEFPLGTEALPYNFPRRNRLISGLSKGVVVVEAGAKSGTLKTVDYALEQGRDVFCVPGNVTSATSKGTNRLLKEGAAAMMTCAEDVWQHYSAAPLVRPTLPSRKSRAAVPDLDAEDKRLLQALKEPLRADELIDRGLTGLSAGPLLAKLSMLEIRGLIRQLPGKYYQTVIRHIRA